ncbi:MAG: hypothetical protein LH702_29600 [Phormidesmis sp. CAN_BIN44]|nr:hypothetical protein [Phormidesmis sp. CAN_BIN44]
MVQRVWLFGKRFLVGSLIALLCTVPAIAQRSPGQRFISDYATSPKCQIKSGTPEKLHMARVCGLGGTVGLSSSDLFKKSSLGTRVLTPPVQIETQARSASELYFNDRVVARTSKGRFTFRKGLKKVELKGLKLEVTTKWQSVGVVAAAKSLFLPGAYDAQVKRFAQAETVFDETIFELAEGTILAMIPPDVVLTEIQTPQSRIEVGAALSVPSNRVASQNEILEKRPVQVATLSPLLPFLSQAQNQLLPSSTRSSVVIVRHDSTQNTTQVFALTEGVRVSGSQGGRAVELRGGETVAVANGVVGSIQTFNLARFYQTTGLANGLGPGQEDAIALEPVEIQRTIRLVRGETLAAVEDQRGFFQRGSGTPLDQPRSPVASPSDGGSSSSRYRRSR